MKYTIDATGKHNSRKTDNAREKSKLLLAYLIKNGSISEAKCRELYDAKLHTAIAYLNKKLKAEKSNYRAKMKTDVKDVWGIKTKRAVATLHKRGGK